MNRKAFSAVELCVVVAIIGILIALLLPAIFAARRAAGIHNICEKYNIGNEDRNWAVEQYDNAVEQDKDPEKYIRLQWQTKRVEDESVPSRNSISVQEEGVVYLVEIEGHDYEITIYEPGEEADIRPSSRN